MTELIVLFVFFGWVSLMLKSSDKGFMRKIPTPPEQLREKERGIKIIKGSVPRMKNPPPPPKKKGNCAMDCGNTYPSPGPDVICLNCGSSIIKPELPKDRIGCNV